MGVSTFVKDYGTDVLNAIRENELNKLRALLEKHLRSKQKMARLAVFDIKHKPTKKMACPLILAARQEDPRIMHYLLECGADPNFIHHTVYSSRRREIVTAMHVAVDLGYYDTTQALLDANADCNIADHNQETPLHIAVKKADRIMARMLLSRGADPCKLDRRENTPLHVASQYGHLQLVRTLLKFNADVHQKGQHGSIAPHIAAREGHIHLIQLFCSRDEGNINTKIACYGDQREKALIHLAAENGHVETVLALLDQFDADVNLRDSDGNTALHCAVLHQYSKSRMRDKEYTTETARILMRYRVAVNEKNEYGDTALHLAAMNQYQNVVELLLRVGANPHLKNDHGLQPIDVVPDFDTVTKHKLKDAMLNPRPSLNISTDTLLRSRDIDISLAGSRAHLQQNFVRSRSDRSIGSLVSVQSSVFAPDRESNRPKDRGGGAPGDHRRSQSHGRVKERVRERERMHSDERESRTREAEDLDLSRQYHDPADERFDRTRNDIRDSVRDGRRDGLRDGRRDGLWEEPRDGLRDAPRDGFREVPRDGLRDGPRDGLRDGPRDGLRDGPRDGLRDAPRDGLRDAPRDGFREVPRGGLRDGPRDGLRDGQRDGLRDGPHDGLRDGPRDGLRDGPRDSHRIHLPRGDVPTRDDSHRASGRGERVSPRYLAEGPGRRTPPQTVESQTRSSGSSDGRSDSGDMMTMKINRMFQSQRRYEEDTESILSQKHDGSHYVAMNNHGRPKPSPRYAPLKSPDSDTTSLMSFSGSQLYDTIDEEASRVRSATMTSEDTDVAKAQSVRIGALPGRKGTVQLQLGGQPITIKYDYRGGGDGADPVITGTPSGSEEAVKRAIRDAVRETTGYESVHTPTETPAGRDSTPFTMKDLDNGRRKQEMEEKLRKEIENKIRGEIEEEEEEKKRMEESIRKKIEDEMRIKEQQEREETMRRAEAKKREEANKMKEEAEREQMLRREREERLRMEEEEGLRTIMEERIRKEEEERIRIEREERKQKEEERMKREREEEKRKTEEERDRRAREERLRKEEDAKRFQEKENMLRIRRENEERERRENEEKEKRETEQRIRQEALDKLKREEEERMKWEEEEKRYWKPDVPAKPIVAGKPRPNNFGGTDQPNPFRPPYNVSLDTAKPATPLTYVRADQSYVVEQDDDEVSPDSTPNTSPMYQKTFSQKMEFFRSKESGSDHSRDPSPTNVRRHKDAPARPNPTPRTPNERYSVPREPNVRRVSSYMSSDIQSSNETLETTGDKEDEMEDSDDNDVENDDDGDAYEERVDDSVAAEAQRLASQKYFNLSRGGRYAGRTTASSPTRFQQRPPDSLAGTVAVELRPHLEQESQLRYRTEDDARNVTEQTSGDGPRSHQVISVTPQQQVSPNSYDQSERGAEGLSRCLSPVSDTSEGGTRRLHMRVSGSVPKAYCRQDRDEARRQFMKAEPVRIESSSDASDSEHNASRLTADLSAYELDFSNTETPRPDDARQDLHDDNVKRGVSPNAENVETSVRLIGQSIPPPYRSLGPIEANTDALNEELDDNQDDMWAYTEAYTREYARSVAESERINKSDVHNGALAGVRLAQHEAFDEISEDKSSTSASSPATVRDADGVIEEPPQLEFVAGKHFTTGLRSEAYYPNERVRQLPLNIIEEERGRSTGFPRIVESDQTQSWTVDMATKTTTDPEATMQMTQFVPFESYRPEQTTEIGGSLTSLEQIVKCASPILSPGQTQEPTTDRSNRLQAASSPLPEHQAHYTHDDTSSSVEEFDFEKYSDEPGRRLPPRPTLQQSVTLEDAPTPNAFPPRRIASKSVDNLESIAEEPNHVESTVTIIGTIRHASTTEVPQQYRGPMGHQDGKGPIGVPFKDQIVPQFRDQREPHFHDQRDDQRNAYPSDQSDPHLRNEWVSSDRKDPHFRNQRDPNDQKDLQFKDPKDTHLNGQIDPQIRDQREPYLRDQKDNYLTDQRNTQFRDQRDQHFNDKEYLYSGNHHSGYRGHHNDAQRNPRDHHSDVQRDPRDPHYDAQRDLGDPHSDARRNPGDLHYDVQRDLRDPHYAAQRDSRYPHLNVQRDPRDTYHGVQSDPRDTYHGIQSDPRDYHNDSQREHHKKTQLDEEAQRDHNEEAQGNPREEVQKDHRTQRDPYLSHMVHHRSPLHTPESDPNDHGNRKGHVEAHDCHSYDPNSYDHHSYDPNYDDHVHNLNQFDPHSYDAQRASVAAGDDLRIIEHETVNERLEFQGKCSLNRYEGRGNTPTLESEEDREVECINRRREESHEGKSPTDHSEDGEGKRKSGKFSFPHISLKRKSKISESEEETNTEKVQCESPSERVETNKKKSGFFQLPSFRSRKRSPSKSVNENHVQESKATFEETAEKTKDFGFSDKKEIVGDVRETDIDADLDLPPTSLSPPTREHDVQDVLLLRESKDVSVPWQSKDHQAEMFRLLDSAQLSEKRIPVKSHEVPERLHPQNRDFTVMTVINDSKPPPRREVPVQPEAEESPADRRENEPASVFTRNYRRPPPIHDVEVSQRGFAEYEDSQQMTEGERHSINRSGYPDVKTNRKTVRLPARSFEEVAFESVYGGLQQQQRQRDNMNDTWRRPTGQYRSDEERYHSENDQSFEATHYVTGSPIGSRRRPPPHPNGNLPPSPKRVEFRDERKRRKKRERASRLEPAVIDFRKYGMTAQLWMEQVDRATVQRSRAMKLAILPPDINLPSSLTRELQHSDAQSTPQWVIARGRALRASRSLSQSSLGRPDSDVELDPERPKSQGKQKLLFFKLSNNWKDLVWILFGDLQDESDTVHMIKDIELKNENDLRGQIHDLMNRWWIKRGSGATIEELQRALDAAHFGYIPEESFLQTNTLTSYTDTEDELDISHIDESDPNLSRLIDEHQNDQSSFEKHYSKRHSGDNFDSANRSLSSERLPHRGEGPLRHSSNSSLRSLRQPIQTSLGSRRQSPKRDSRGSDVRLSGGSQFAERFQEEDGKFHLIPTQHAGGDYRHETTI